MIYYLLLNVDSNRMINLAITIIRERCGPLCQIVMSELFNERRTIGQIITHTGIPAKTVGRALLVLLQFNYVNSHRSLDSIGEIKNVYVPKLTVILQTLQLPIIFSFTRDAYGYLAEQILISFAKHGRLTIEESIQACQLGGNKLQMAGISKTHLIITTKLIKEHILERVQTFDIFTNFPFNCDLKMVINKNIRFNIPSQKILEFGKKIFGVYDSKKTSKTSSWQISYKTLEQNLRYDKCFRCITKGFGKTIGQILRIVLQTLEGQQSKFSQTPQLSIKDLSFIRQANFFVRTCGGCKQLKREFHIKTNMAFFNRIFSNSKGLFKRNKKDISTSILLLISYYFIIRKFLKVDRLS
eukprot:gnl/MRDRNA2_/MRDRNA2_86724_c0_seq2.p1 gnl/MRDRNA2_/MRDRNA2_86724_c0~~gnl/MRDRNA2_/MRDRNA2_86724_c0_seq2.p1  ORF type:complete len:355 (+),score=-19.00 gnl/MRDRNA2_/MRDRNA2_86724_c0_seq2:400-1464(+)